MLPSINKVQSKAGNCSSPVLPPTATLPPTHSLRILLVDDNHVNLSVLSTLLKRRFAHVLAKPPVALDSGLKALQTLRTEIFDLIFMDIEMPYLDGVECARRIRAGEDGILKSNQNAHIVAVTTNVGPEPASLYRHVGMDGMISKPVRFQQFRQYLCPLSVEAFEARGSVTPVLVGSEKVMPPMPPIHLDQRLFFTPSIVEKAPLTGDVPSPQDAVQYSDANEFAAMLKEQTAKSLRDRKAMSSARTGSVSEGAPRRSSVSSPRSEHVAGPRACMIQQDGDNLEKQKFVSFQTLIDNETDSQIRQKEAARPAAPVRPIPVHRISSPAYMLDSSPLTAHMRDDFAMQSNPDLTQTRPSIRPLGTQRPRTNSGLESGGATPGSIAWSSTEGGTTTSTSSMDVLSFSRRATSPSSVSTTSMSSPADLEFADDAFAKALFSPCADDEGLLPAPPTAWMDPFLTPASTKLSSFRSRDDESPSLSMYTVDRKDLGLPLDNLRLGQPKSPLTARPEFS